MNKAAHDLGEQTHIYNHEIYEHGEIIRATDKDTAASIRIVANNVLKSVEVRYTRYDRKVDVIRDIDYYDYLDQMANLCCDREFGIVARFAKILKVDDDSRSTTENPPF